MIWNAVNINKIIKDFINKVQHFFLLDVLALVIGALEKRQYVLRMGFKLFILTLPLIFVKEWQLFP
jgi:hypothetical protein